MLTILVLFVGLTLATAVIAYWSDNLGKKLGKKRVSLWGMRPRTTATFLTIASSWLIMIFTLGVLLTLFRPLRQALLRYDEVKANESKLKDSKERLDVQVGGLNEQLATLTSQTTALQDQAQTASDKLKTAGQKLNQSRQAATRARDSATAARQAETEARKSASQAKKRQQAAVKRAQDARDNLQKVRGQLNSTRSQREAAERQLNAAQTELNQANTDVKNANQKVKSANQRVKDANRKVAEAEAQLDSVQRELSSVRADLAQAKQSEISAKASAVRAGQSAIKAGQEVIQSSKEVIEANKQVAEARARVAALAAQSEQLQSDNDKLSSINENLSNDNKKYRDTAFILSRSDVRVPVDSTLVEHSFERLTSASDVRRELRAMFERSADQIVPALLPDAGLEFANLPSSDGKRLLTPDEIYDNLVNFIADNPGALSVRLVAARNHLAGESVLESKFLVVPIRPALPDDFELARVELDGRSNQGPLFSALLDLVDEGTAVAKSKGITPPLSPDVPNFYVPGSREQIFETLREIKNINGPARVRIITTQPISTADQLSVKFAVDPVNPVSTQTNARLAPQRLAPTR